MSGNVESNRIAKMNGDWAESFVKSTLKVLFQSENIELMNELIDYNIGGELVEVKSCQMEIQALWHYTGKRYGFYQLVEAQHKYLQENDGFYLFVVKSDCGAVRMKVVRARNMKFQKNLTWRRVFGDRYPKEDKEFGD